MPRPFFRGNSARVYVSVVATNLSLAEIAVGRFPAACHRRAVGVSIILANKSTEIAVATVRTTRALDNLNIVPSLLRFRLKR